MAGFILRRLLWTVVVLWGIATLTFIIVHFSPVDPARAYAGPRASEETVEATRVRFGLDAPLHVQYQRYLSRVVRGDFGESFITGRPVKTEVLERAPKTFQLALVAAALQAAVGVVLGTIAARRRDTLTDQGILFGTLLGLVTPSFVLGFVLLYIFSFKLRWLPLGGSESMASIILPAVTLAVTGMALYARLTRSTLLGIMNQDYARLARAKGLPPGIILRRHLLPNAAGPIVTVAALDLGVFLGGVLVVERVFNWPGLGQLAWTAINVNDVSLVMGVILFAALSVTLLNLLADILNALIDPRVRTR